MWFCLWPKGRNMVLKAGDFVLFKVLLIVLARVRFEREAKQLRESKMSKLNIIGIYLSSFSPGKNCAEV